MTELSSKQNIAPHLIFLILHLILLNLCNPLKPVTKKSRKRMEGTEKNGHLGGASPQFDSHNKTELFSKWNLPPRLIFFIINFHSFIFTNPHCKIDKPTPPGINQTLDNNTD